MISISEIEYKRTLSIINSFLNNELKIKTDEKKVKFVNIISNTSFDIFNLMYTPKDECFDEFNVYKFNGKNFFLVKNIYDNKNKKLIFKPNIDFFDDNYEKITTILSSFYKKINISLILDCSLENEKIIINEYMSKIHFSKPLYKSFDSLNHFNPYLTFFRNKNDDLINNFYSDIKEYTIIKKTGIDINREQNIDELINKLNLIKIFLI